MSPSDTQPAGTPIPRPAADEASAPGFDIGRWSLRSGVCPYHGGEHDFAGRGWCRLCREDRSFLVRMSRTHRIFEGPEA